MKCCDMYAGKLNRLIEIYSLSTTKTATGGASDSWAIRDTYYARVEPVSGMESVRFDRLGAHGVTRFIIRYNEDVVESDKIVYKGVDYQIRSIINIEEADLWLEIMGEKGVAQ